MTADVDRLNGERIVEFQPAGAPFGQIGQTALEAKEGRGGETDLVGIIIVFRRRRVRRARDDQRYAEAVCVILVLQTFDFVIVAEQQRAKFLRLPGKTDLSHGQSEGAVVAGGQAQRLARIEAAKALGGDDALGEAGVVEVAGEAETRIEGIGRRQAAEPLSETAASGAWPAQAKR